MPPKSDQRDSIRRIEAAKKIGMEIAYFKESDKSA
jgi:hypothetical protein